MPLELPRLLEQVDVGLAVRAEAEPRAGREQRVRGHHAVTEVPLRRRARADVRRRPAEAREVVFREVHAVHRGEVRAGEADLVDEPGRAHPVLRLAGAVLRGLLGQVQVHHSACACRGVVEPLAGHGAALCGASPTEVSGSCARADADLLGAGEVRVDGRPSMKRRWRGFGSTPWPARA